MPVYKWEGKTLRGAIKRGELEAASEAALRIQLRQQNIIPTKVLSKGKEIKLQFSLGGRKITEKAIAVFTRQLATMIDAGLPLVQSLDILATQQENRSFKQVLSTIKDDVESGSTFAAALGRHPKVFNDLYVNLVVAGEEGGILDNILLRLSNYIEKAVALKKKVKSALVYPIAIVGVAVIVVTILLIFVIPVFEKMFLSAGHSLPLLTQIIVTMSRLLKSYFIFVVAGLVILGIGLRRYHKTGSGRRNIDALLLKVPVFGMLFRKIAIARFSRTLSTLVSSGVPILDSLNIVAKTAGNQIVEDAIMRARSSISEGETIAEPLTRADVFPPMVTQMISVGESTGSLDTMLGKIADFYDDEVDTTVATLTSLLEPFLMIFLGGTIGTIVVAMYLPIFNMASAIG
ncbi:MAG: type II secretion system F family protein [Deltaproteobacteria bacterium]|nr:type II secretion system F family protein [Deltaproteobacteria bacterium]MBW2120370.1 type II secretion system F family protein [Deltaproteobacteria bacterium]